MIKKTIFTLNINDHAKEITDLTYPLIKYYAHKIGADFHIIKERRFPEFPITYEKLQIFELAQEMQNDWNIYIDSDALVHPEMVDWTAFMKKDTIAHNGSDMANIRWRYDKYFLRDGRNWGSCNWMTIASDWCVDLWHPLELSVAEALDNIYPTAREHNTVVTTDHLIDDYALSRNVARYGLKTVKLQELQKEIGLGDAFFLWHEYLRSIDEKLKGWDEKVFDANLQTERTIHISGVKEILKLWQIPKFIREYGTTLDN